jgi:hypothetical protein
MGRTPGSVADALVGFLGALREADRPKSGGLLKLLPNHMRHLIIFNANPFQKLVVRHKVQLE